MVSYEFCEISKNIFFIEHLRTTASVWKQSYFCVKRLFIGMQLIKEYKSIVNGLIKTISDKTLYKLHLTNIFKKSLPHYILHSVVCKELGYN